LSERYRREIVKTKAINRMIDDIELPSEGFGELTLDIGAICDGCQKILEPGDNVFYHLRLGSIYCNKCNGTGE